MAQPDGELTVGPGVDKQRSKTDTAETAASTFGAWRWTEEATERVLLLLSGGATASASGPLAKRRFGDDAVAGEGQGTSLAAM